VLPEELRVPGIVVRRPGRGASAAKAAAKN